MLVWCVIVITFVEPGKPSMQIHKLKLQVNLHKLACCEWVETIVAVESKLMIVMQNFTMYGNICEANEYRDEVRVIPCGQTSKETTRI